LNDLLTEYRPLLSKHGLVVTQFPSGNGSVGVTTILAHESGEFISDTVTLPIKEAAKNIAQEAGADITYLRRYAFSAVTGIASEDDNDANRPKTNGSKQEKPNGQELALAKGKVIKMLDDAEEKKLITSEKRQEAEAPLAKYHTVSAIEAYGKKVAEKIDSLQEEQELGVF
jgi:hypothetical protein